MKKYKQVTEEEFKQVKMLCDAGFIPSQIRSIIKRSGNPVYDMIKSQTFDEYKRKTSERAQRRKKDVENEVSDLDDTTTILIPNTQQQEVLQVLHSIDNNLKYLINNLPVHEKRGIFR